MGRGRADHAERIRKSHRARERDETTANMVPNIAYLVIGANGTVRGKKAESLVVLNVLWRVYLYPLWRYSSWLEDPILT